MTQQSESFQPTRDDRFTFGLWTVGNPGRDPFGAPTRARVDPVDTVEMLSELGAMGVNFHDDDLIPAGSPEADRQRIIKDFKAALKRTGLTVPMATTNLFSDPVFKDGAFTSADARVRAFALQKTMRAMELGVEMGAKTYVFWGGREGTEVDAGKRPADAIRWFRDALDFLCDHSLDQGYDLKFALEAKPNEPRADIFFPTTGSYLAFIETLKHADMVGVNPEVAHEHMAGLNMHHAVAQAMECGKLFHIDLNDQRPGRYDQDFRFGAENPKAAFYLVRALEDGAYDGPLHFDAHAYRSEDADGVVAFARGCMRTYLILRDKVRRMRDDREIQDAIAGIAHHDAELERLCQSYEPEKAESLKSQTFDTRAIAERGLGYEHLDQMVTELLLGVR